MFLKIQGISARPVLLPALATAADKVIMPLHLKGTKLIDYTLGAGNALETVCQASLTISMMVVRAQSDQITLELKRQIIH